MLDWQECGDGWVDVCVCACVSVRVWFCVILVCNYIEATLFGPYFSICMCDDCGGWVGVG